MDHRSQQRLETSVEALLPPGWIRSGFAPGKRCFKSKAPADRNRLLGIVPKKNIAGVLLPF